MLMLVAMHVPHVSAAQLPYSATADCLPNPDAGLEGQIKELAAQRNMKEDTIGPVITWTTEAMLGHVDSLLKIPGEAPF